MFAATLMLRQRESPPDRLGQVNTTAGSLKIGASAVGAALTAASAAAIGPGSALCSPSPGSSSRARPRGWCSCAFPQVKNPWTR